MGEFEAVSDAVTGGIVGRAVEPQAGQSLKNGLTHDANCLNCGARLLGPYCFECGQHAQVHQTLSAFFHDFAHGVLHFEGKVFRTLPLLVLRPGELTRRYIDGQRASFVSPIALFLFCVFFMFAVVGLTTNMSKAAASASQALQKDQQQLDRLKSQRAGATGQVAAKLDRKISALQDEMTTLKGVKEGKLNANFDLTGGLLSGFNEPLKDAAKNPELLFYKLKTNAYKFSWALIPISLPFVWLLFPFSRRFKLYDHTVFVTYSLCFMMLLLAAASLVGLVSDSIASLAWFVPPVHMYRQLRGAYGVSNRGAIWRTGLLTLFAFIAISIFAILQLALGAFD